MGHTLLTHGYLMDDDVHDVAPHCEFCNSAILTIKHIMVECEQLSDTRRDCLEMCRLTGHLIFVGKEHEFFEVVYFLNNIGVYILI